MTKLTYLVGNKEIVSYQEAIQQAAENKLQVVPKYTAVEKESKADPARLEKIAGRRMKK